MDGFNSAMHCKGQFILTGSPQAAEALYTLLIAKIYCSTLLAQVGKPDDDWRNDPKGKPENLASKVVRGTAKAVIKQGKRFIPSTGDQYLDGAIQTVADVTADQIGADPNASFKARLMMAGSDILSGVVDNTVIQAYTASETDTVKQAHTAGEN